MPADPSTVSSIKQVIETIREVPIENLISNPKWGTLNFEGARSGLELILQLASHLADLPIEVVPENSAQVFAQSLRNTATTIGEIRNFSIETAGAPAQTRDQIVQRVRTHADELLVTTQGWIPFLAYQKGDVQRNIEQLAQTLSQAKKLLDDASAATETRKMEIDSIISAAREASASAGVGVFTKDFEEQSEKNEAQAAKWLTATVVSAGLTIGVTAFSFFFPLEKDASFVQIAQYTTSKIILLVTLLTATIWCGRLYKAMKHQASINAHRANALRTFQAFIKATSDEPTRNAVLLETTRSIFNITPSGYLEGGDAGADQGLKVLEIFKGSAAGAGR